VPETRPVEAATMLGDAAWRSISWRRGTMIGSADHPSRVPSMFDSLEVQVLYPAC
jgi:hypothetical protein